jgi:hypothetical protein
MLRIHIDTRRSCEAYLEMSNMPLLVSRHLIRLEPCMVRLSLRKPGWLSCIGRSGD